MEMEFEVNDDGEKLGGKEDNIDNFKEFVNIHNVYLNSNFNSLGISSGMSLEELEREFKKFSGDYLEALNKFRDMEPKDQKLFILYSMFHLGLMVDRENMDKIMTDDVLVEAKHLAKKFSDYGSYTDCAVGFVANGSELGIRGIGYNISELLKSNKCIKSVDSFSIDDVVSFADAAYSANSEEKHIFQLLNEKRSQELSAFQELVSTLKNNKTTK